MSKGKRHQSRLPLKEYESDITKLCRARPTGLKELAELVADLAYLEDVCPTVPGHMSLTEDKGVYYPSFESYEATSFNAMMYHLRQHYTENTIRAVFAYFGTQAGYMRSPNNASGGKPFNGMSVRTARTSAAWQMGSGCSV